MRLKITLFLSALLCFITQANYAQEKTITGTVTDVNNLPLPGVNIIIEGTNTGTQSDFNGNFSITASEGQVLEFSYVGYSPKSITVTALTSSLTIVMTEDAAVLDEVLIIGYGTQSKRRLTDNIAKINAEDIAEIPTPTLQSALSARAAGVRVAQTNGKVESGINIRVRGASSIGASSEPLYVIDGVPIVSSDQTGSGGIANPLISLSINEIESIDILKDASSASIYGSRAANGVILITTKKGKEGKAQFSVNVAHGVSNPANKREWMNANEYIDFFTEAAINRYGEATGTVVAENLFRQLLAVPAEDAENWRNYIIDTDWQDLAFQSGYTTDADFSMSGGDAKTTYYFSGAYNNSKGIIRGNELERVSARANVQHKLNDRFMTGMNLNYSRTLVDRIADDRAFVTPMQAIAQPALNAAFLEDGEPNPNTLYPNFLLQDKHAFYNSLIRRTTGNVFGEYKIFPSLKFKSDFGYELFSQQENAFTGSQAPFQSTNGEAWNRDVDVESYIYSNYFTFSENLNRIHDIDIVAGMEYNRSDTRIIYVEGIEFPSDDFQTISSAGEISGGDGSITNHAFLSYFGRASYAFNNKYLLKASIRRDASSRFGSGNRWGTFPSVSAGWIVSEENFMNEGSTFSFLKLRASWGQVGNAEVGNHSWRYLFGVGTYNNRPGLVSSQAPNLNLSWEKQDQVDIGVELGFLNNKIMLEVDYYNKQIDGLLFEAPLPWTSGEDIITRNIGLMENKGWEFVINTKNIDKDDFTWNTSINLSQNKNKVIRLPEGNDIPSDFNILREGEAINAFYLVEYAGVNPDNGDALFYLNRDATPEEMASEDFFIVDGRVVTTLYNNAERTIIGQPLPEWIGGLTNNILYKGFDFSFTLQGEWGASIYNYGGRFQSSNGLFDDNQSRDQLDRWQQPGDITNVPQARFGLNNGGQNSTRYLQKADFVRLRNITLGYSIPKQALEKSGFTKVRVYVTGFNILTFTNYNGYDPEARDDSTSLGAARGLDFYSAPAAKTYTLGVNFNF